MLLRCCIICFQSIFELPTNSLVSTTKKPLELQKDLELETAADPERRMYFARKRAKIFKLFQKNKVTLLLALALLPLFSYFYFIGRDRYVVQSAVVVRKATEDSVPALGLTGLLGGGNQQSIEDARYLKTYLTSPQVLEDLEKTIDFRSAYARKGLDFFPGVSKDASREDVFEVFTKQISVDLIEISGELAIKSFAFDPEMALKLNRFLIAQAENFVNKLNQDVYLRQVDFAQEQVNINANRVREASLKVEEFQESNRILDVESVAQGSEQFIAALEGELAKQRVELATLKRKFSDPSAPEIEAVDAQVQELQAQISNERRSLVSSTGKDLNAKALKLAGLESNLLFATDLYKGAIAAAEQTRVDSQQQQRFMAVLSKPLLPESAWQYWRHKGFLTSLGVLFVVYAFFRFFKSMLSSRH